METQQGVILGNFKHYLIAFIASILFILASFFVVKAAFISTWIANIIVTILALAQAWVQLVIFLNLGRETKPRWNLIIFLFTVMIIFIVVFGSLWIMHHLNYNLMQ